MNDKDNHYMQLAIDLARKGQGRTSPNPCVGAVIVNNGRVVGRGYHRKAGDPHAEVNAIADAGVAARDSTLYVTLEPCNHTGRTPPCTRAILDAGISRVVVGMADPNPSVEGNGSSFLLTRGIKVETGVLEDECVSLNRPFIKHCATGLPWVVMKAGMSLDGKISREQGHGGKITGSEAWSCTHTLRNSLDAILVGIGTAIIDDPSLTTRLPENMDVRDPVRVVLDTHLRMPLEIKMLNQKSAAATMIFCGPDAAYEKEQRLTDKGAVVQRIGLDTHGQLAVMDVLQSLGKSDINSVLVEGGAAVHGAMLQQKTVDEVYLFIAPFFIGQSGTSLLQGFYRSEMKHDICLRKVEVRQIGDDTLIHGFFG